MKSGFFSEAPGELSMARLLSFGAFVMASALAWYSIISGSDNTALITNFLIFSAGVKVGQKFAEAKGEFKNDLQ